MDYIKGRLINHGISIDIHSKRSGRRQFAKMDELGTAYQTQLNLQIANAKRLCHCWNHFDGLVAALEFALKNIKVDLSCRLHGGCDTYLQIKNCRGCKAYKEYMAEIETAKAVLDAIGDDNGS